VLVACGSPADPAEPSATPTTVASSDVASEPEASATAPVTDCSDVFSKITYESVDGQPSLNFNGVTVSTETSQVCVLAPGGEGDPLVVGDYITLNYIEYDATGSVVGSSTSSSQPTGQIQAADVGDPISNAVVGQRVGVMIGMAAPYDATTAHVVLFQVASMSKEPPASAAAPTPTISQATGKKASEVNPDIPAVTLDDSGKPSITPLSGNPPTELISEVLIEGDGPEVTESQTLVVHYTGWLWDGTQFDSSWDRGETASFALTGVIQGWTQGLAGKKVGSQVELVIPPSLGYGDTDQGSIPAGSTLVFVVDILAAG
jgi:peptidylprolyl isomerase